MPFIERVRTMNKRLRLMLLATALLFVPQVGQFVSIRSLNVSHQQSAIGLLLALVGIFIIPTSLILSLAILYSYRATLKTQQPIVLLGVLNILIALSLAWFTVGQCSWSQAVGIGLYGCK